MDEDAETLHATCITIGHRGVLIRGPSGTGKSDLALRFIYTPLPEGFGVARLVSDDQVNIFKQQGTLGARTAPNLDNKLEVRGIGIVNLETVKSTLVSLVVDAVPKHEISRMPEEHERWTSLMSVRVPRLALALLEPSAVAKILHSLDEL